MFLKEVLAAVYAEADKVIAMQSLTKDGLVTLQTYGKVFSLRSTLCLPSRTMELCDSESQILWFAVFCIYHGDLVLTCAWAVALQTLVWNSHDGEFPCEKKLIHVEN